MIHDKNNPLNLYTSKILEYPDLLKNFLFQVNFQFNANTILYNLVQSLEKSYGYDTGGSVGETLMLRARSISLPKKTTGKINTHYMGSLRNYPGRTKTDGDVNIKFDEFQDLATQRFFFEWQNAIYNHGVPAGPKGVSQFSIEPGGAVSDFLAQYTAEVEIHLFDSALKNELSNYWVLYDVFPTDNGTINLDAEGEGKVSPELTFNYNTWDMISRGVGLVNGVTIRES